MWLNPNTRNVFSGGVMAAIINGIKSDVHTYIDADKLDAVRGSGEQCADGDAERGQPTPISNRGGIEGESQGKVPYRCYDDQVKMYIGTRRNPILMEQPRRGIADSAIVDWLTVTFPTNNLNKLSDTPINSDGEAILFMSSVLEKIMGFGITRKMEKGMWMHKERYTCGSESAMYANVLVGHSADIITLDINGTGCNAGTEGWEQAMYGFINAVGGHITRCDVAKDFFEEEYTPEKAYDDWNKGLFTCRGVRPKGQQIGTDWLNDDESGKTFGVGVRGGAKYARIYDKAKQLGDVENFWVRFEVEYRRRDGWIIPNEILIAPGHYWGGAYPICEDYQTEVKRITAKKKLIETTIETVVANASNQVGKVINFLVELGWDDGSIIQKLTPKHKLFPRALIPERFFAADCEDVPIHRKDLPLLAEVPF